MKRMMVVASAQKYNQTVVVSNLHPLTTCLLEIISSIKILNELHIKYLILFIQFVIQTVECDKLYGAFFLD